MSKPTDRYEDEAWWRAALAGEKPRIDGEVHVGWYKTTKFRNSPMFPVRIWRDGPVDDDKNLIGDEKLCGLFDGKPVNESWLDEKWTFICLNPISVEDYKLMMNGTPEEQTQSRTTSLAEADPVF